MDLSGRRTSVSKDKSPDRIPNLDPLSPGPMTLSELQTPPKKLQPIEKQTKTRRTSRARAEGMAEKQPVNISNVVTSTLEEQSSTAHVDLAALNKMRARLDPFYNRPLPPVVATKQLPEYTAAELRPSTADHVPPSTALPPLNMGHLQPSTALPPPNMAPSTALPPPNMAPSTALPPPNMAPSTALPPPNMAPSTALPPPNMAPSTALPPPSRGELLPTPSQGEDVTSAPKRKKQSRRRMRTVESPNDEESTRSTSAASSKAGRRDRRTSSPVPDPQQHVQSSKESSPKSVTCDVETVTNMNTEVRAQPCADSPDHTVSLRPLPALPPSLDTPLPTLSQSTSVQEGTSPSPHARLALGRSGDPMLLVSDEDIVEPPAPTAQAVDTGTVLILGSTQPPQSTGVVFVEKEDGSGFVAKKSSTHMPSDSRLESSIFAQGITATKFALGLHSLIQGFMLSLHGLLSGLSLWDCVVAGVLSREGTGHLNLLQQYSSLTLPLHTIHLLILLPLAASMLDRIDILRPSRQCALHFVHSPRQMVLLAGICLVFFALIITVSLASIDERIQLYSIQPGLWTDILTITNTTSSGATSPTTAYTLTAHPTSSKLIAWLVLITLRAACCILSWVIMSWFTSYDRLREYLHAVNERCKISLNSSEPIQN